MPSSRTRLWQGTAGMIWVHDFLSKRLVAVLLENSQQGKQAAGQLVLCRPCALIKEWRDLLTEVGDHQSLVVSLKQSPYYHLFKVVRCSLADEGSCICCSAATGLLPWDRLACSTTGDARAPAPQGAAFTAAEHLHTAVLLLAHTTADLAQAAARPRRMRRWPGRVAWAPCPRGFSS